MQISEFNYKKSAFVTYTLLDDQSPLTRDQFDELVGDFLDATDMAGFIHGHFDMHYDGEKTLKITVPFSKEVGGELAAGLAIGYFLALVDNGKLFKYGVVKLGKEKFDPALEYIPMLPEDATDE